MTNQVKNTALYENFISMMERSLKEQWDKPAVRDFMGEGLNYSEFAKRIATLKLLWEKAGLEPGAKVALNARSSSHWIEVFIAAVTGGYVSVQLFNGFLPSDVQQLVNHSDSRILYTEKNIFKSIDFEAMPDVVAVIDTESFELLASRNGFDSLYAEIDSIFDSKYPDGYKASDVSYVIKDMEDVCAIMYTSGSTGNPKGVMLTVRNFSVNVMELQIGFPYKPKENYVSILPYAHIFGLTCDVVTPLSLGMQVIVLGRPPIPANVKAIMTEYHPKVFLAVPLILSKFVESTVGDVLKSEESRKKLENYEENREFCNGLRERVMDALGGNIEAFATGGAAIAPEVESLLAFQINMPFLTGYGMTECAPLMALGHVGSYKRKSCGELIGSIEAKIDSIDPKVIPGELQVKGDMVFAGYYKNPEATKNAFTEDGWFRTGDMGTIDEDGTLFLVGRCKSMLLSSNGQNIFPEEIEVVLNSLAFVAESIIVQRNESHLHAIIVPKMDQIEEKNLDADTMNAIMQNNIKELNKRIPTYSQVGSFELRFEPLAKTPKGSIKRFMYS